MKNKSLINCTYGYNIDVERKVYDIVTNDYIKLFECIANFITYSPYANELISENVRKDFNKLYVELRC